MLRNHFQIFLVLLIFVSTQSLNSQTTSAIDSLYNSLNKRGIKTAQKLEILSQIIDYRKTSYQYNEMKLAIDEANELMKGSNDSCAHNKLLLLEAQYASAIGDRLKANALADKILISSQLNECQETEIATLLFQANMLLQSRNPDTCLNKIKHAKSLARVINDEILFADGLYQEGIFKILNKNLIEGRQILKQALNTYVENDEQAKIGNTNADIGYTYYLQSEYDTAFMYYFTSIPFLEKGMEYGYLAMVYNNVALIYQNTGKISKAITTYFEGLKIADRINSGSNRRLILYNLGNCYHSLDAKENAFESYSSSLKEAEIANDTILIIYASNAIGNMAIDNNQIDTAMKYVTKSYNLAKMKNNRYAIIFGSLSMARLEILKNNLSLAKEYLNIANSYASRINNPEDFFLINITQAQYYAKKKNTLNPSIYLKKHTERQ